MKKTFVKKLSLNKTTVSNLNLPSMAKVRGGYETFHGEACPDFDTGAPCESDNCGTDVTCVTCAVSCETCNTNCGQNTCQVTCHDLITG